MTDRELLIKLKHELMEIDIHCGNGRIHQANNLAKKLWADIGQHLEDSPQEPTKGGQA